VRVFYLPARQFLERPTPVADRLEPFLAGALRVDPSRLEPRSDLWGERGEVPGHRLSACPTEPRSLGCSMRRRVPPQMFCSGIWIACDPQFTACPERTWRAPERSRKTDVGVETLTTRKVWSRWVAVRNASSTASRIFPARCRTRIFPAAFSRETIAPNRCASAPERGKGRLSGPNGLAIRAHTLGECLRPTRASYPRRVSRRGMRGRSARRERRQKDIPCHRR